MSLTERSTLLQTMKASTNRFPSIFCCLLTVQPFKKIDSLNSAINESNVKNKKKVLEKQNIFSRQQ